MATKRTTELIDLFKSIVEEVESSETDRETSLKKLFKYDKEWAEEKLEEFVTRRRPWAIALALRIEEDKAKAVGGIGIL